jgi:hypothetical protein
VVRLEIVKLGREKLGWGRAQQSVAKFLGRTRTFNK